MHLIVGLGNPGKEYETTRHNAGFMALDRIAARYGLTGTKSNFHGAVAQGMIEGQKCLLLKPMTFMNRSGLAVGQAVQFYKLSLSQVLVLVDDIALPAGALRLRAGGGAGGHNGLKDIQRVLGSQQYPRLRIGVDPPGRANQVDYVLGRFGKSQWPDVDLALDRTADAAASWLTGPIDQAMTKVNAW